jgi:lipoprotein-anchoring transpeptidase ErfK/SrfK
VLLRDPENVTALLWMAWLADDRGASLAYVYRALTYDPENSDALAALHWAQRRADTPALSAPSPQPTLPPQVARGRGRQVATVIAACLLIVLVGATQTKSLPQGPAMMAASARTTTPTPTAANTPTSTPIPTWTPTAPPTVVPTHAFLPTGTPASTPPLVPSAIPSLPPPPTLSPSSFSGDTRWIEVDLTLQTLNAYQGQKLMRTALVSTGTQGNPTPTGLFRIHTKLRYDDMQGPDYYLPNVPYVMYFHRGYGLHGTYWHANFGHQMSHGCVNIPTAHAEWLFNWAEVGTWVYIHE